MKTVGALVAIGLCAPSMGTAQSVFTGTWRPDPQIYGPDLPPDVYDLSNETFSCQTCTPPYKSKADGHDQPVTGNPYYDALAVTRLDDRSVREIGKKNGQTVFESALAVSDNGQKLTERQTIYFMAPRPIEFTTHFSRVAKGQSGAHALSGTWRRTDGDVTNHAEDTVFKVTGDTLGMSDRMGRSFSAKLDGSEAPYSGSDEFSSVTLKLVDSHTIEESDKKDGKVTKISRWNVAADGRTMHVQFDDTHGHVQEQTGHKVE